MNIIKCLSATDNKPRIIVAEKICAFWTGPDGLNIVMDENILFYTVQMTEADLVKILESIGWKTHIVPTRKKKAGKK